MIGLVLFMLPAHAETVTLDQAWAAAEADSPDLKLLAEQRVQTESLRGQAWSLLQPKLIAGASYNVNQYETLLDFSAFIPPEMQDLFPSSEPIVIQPKHYWQSTVTVQQSLFSGEALPTLLGVYRAVDGARYDEQSSRMKLRGGVAKVYYGLYTAREGEKLSQQALTNAEDQLALAQRQVDAELAAPRTLVQAQLRVSQAKRDVESAHQAVVQTEETFHQLTGLPRDTELVWPEIPAPPATLDEAEGLAQSNRPDLKADGQRIEAARMQSRANWAGWAPDVTGRFTWVYSQNQGFGPSKDFWTLTIEGQWILWDGGYRLAKGREIASQVHSAQIFADRHVTVAEGEVRTAWEGYQRAEAALSAMDDEVELAEKNLELANRAFEADQVPYSDVQLAELGANAAKVQQLVERMNRDTAIVDLLVATGTY